MKNSGDFTRQKRELSEEDRRQAFIDTNQPLIDEALKSMEKSLRADARADKYDLFRSHLQKLGLSKRSPKLMLDVTIEFVETSLLYTPSNQREKKRILHLLSLQRYNLCEVPDARYVFTFNIFGETCGRVVLDQNTDYLGPDLYDLFGCSWEKCNNVGYASLFISHPDWSSITNREFKRLEQSVAFDLRFDGDEDLRFSFRRASDASLLKVTVWDISNGIDPYRSNDHKSRKFKLIEINAFDARHGYKRCSPPGVGTYVDSTKAIADFWKDRNGRLFVSIFSRGYNYHFEAMLASGKQIPQGKMDEFGEWVSEVLLEWLVEGVAMPPEGIYKPYT